ncbi:MAG: four-carbon acid sugar kinase family protein [Ilumatobacteraceae bacterium]
MAVKMAAMLEWLVVADDRTGALEVAGELAASLGPVPVAVRDLSGGHSYRAMVVDLESRHLAPHHAADLAAQHATAVPARRHGHKIDSLLRGNWAHELVAVQRATGQRVLVVPAFPAVGRTCRGGVVHVEGEPSTAADVRAGVPSARAAEHLAAAGAADVVELGRAADVATWTTSFAVCDAVTDADLIAIGVTWSAMENVCFAGTAGSIAAAAAAAARSAHVSRSVEWPPMRASIEIVAPVLVVCGSRHPTALAQLDALAARDIRSRDVEVLQSPVPTGLRISGSDAERVAVALGAATRQRLAAGGIGTVVIIGGDTAAAVLGDTRMLVGGTVAPGMPWSRRADGSGPLVVTKAGGFGHPTTLVELLLDPSSSEARRRDDPVTR